MSYHVEGQIGPTGQVGAKGPIPYCPTCGCNKVHWFSEQDLNFCPTCGWSDGNLLLFSKIQGPPGIVCPNGPEPRISRNKMFMEIARIVARRGTCDRARVGAVLVNNRNDVVSIGYNGAPHGEPHCDEVGHLMFDGHCIRTIHAEENCLEGINFDILDYYTMYVTHYPCAKCQITIFEKIVKSPCTITVVYDNIYGNKTEFEVLPEVKRILKIISLREKEDNDII